MRCFRIIGCLMLPHHLHAGMAHADLFDGDVFLRPFDFLPQRAGLAAVAQLGAKEVGQIFQQGFGIVGAQADQADGGVEAVKQKMRADTRSQRGTSAAAMKSP